MKNAYYTLKYKLACMNHKYFLQTKGDTSRFRYPHIKTQFRNFDTDLKNDLFLLKRNQNEVLRNIARETYPIFKNITNESYYIQVFNILGIKTTKEERIEAYKSIKKIYKNRKFKKLLSKHYSKVDFNTIMINKQYDNLKKFIIKSQEYRTIIFKIKDKNMRNLAHSLHGTNILYIDKEPYNFGVGLIECIINNENGIKGRNLENLKVEEIYATPKNMALLEIIEEPKFANPDIFFMKGYLGLAFNDKDTMYNALYALTEPFAKLLFSTIGMNELMNFVFLNKEPEIYFNEIYPNFYNKIYKEKTLFNRLDVIKEISLKQNIDIINLYKILFNDIALVSTNIDYKVIAFIYLSKKINQNKKLLFDLIANCYPWSIEHNEKITLNNWSKHIRLKYGDSTYSMVAKEYDKVKEIIEKL